MDFIVANPETQRTCDYPGYSDYASAAEQCSAANRKSKMPALAGRQWKVCRLVEVDEAGTPIAASADSDRLRKLTDDLTAALVAIKEHFDSAIEDEATSAHTMRAIAWDVLWRNKLPNT